MQASSIVRYQYQSMLLEFVNLSSGNYNNYTFFFTGAQPTDEELRVYMRDIWIAQRRYPNVSDCSFSDRCLGHVKNFMSQHNWVRANNAINLTNDQVEDVAANTLNWTQYKSLRGSRTGSVNMLVNPEANTALTAETKPITWCLSLLNNRSNIEKERPFVLVNSVGVEGDPTAEVVLEDNMVGTSKLGLVTKEYYLPIFG